MPAEVAQTEIDQSAQTAEVQPGEAQTQDSTPVVEGQQPPVEGAQKPGENAAPKTALEAAKRVMAKGEQPASDKNPLDGTQPTKTADDKSKVEDDDANLPFKEHPRWKKMSSDNRILTVAKTKNEEAIRTLEPKAQTVDDLNGWLSENNLGKDDFANMLRIGAAIRNDPAAAYQQLQPIIEHLEKIVGVRLPADLEQQVQAGSVSREIAQEVARARGSEAVAKGQLETNMQRSARERASAQERESEGRLDVVVETLNACEVDWANREPDAAKLKPLLNDIVLIMGQSNPPQSAEDARKLFTSAVAEAKKRASGFIPARPAKDGILPAGGAVTTTTRPVPKTALEAAMTALRPG